MLYYKYWTMIHPDYFTSLGTIVVQFAFGKEMFLN